MATSIFQFHLTILMSNQQIEECHNYLHANAYIKWYKEAILEVYRGEQEIG